MYGKVVKLKKDVDMLK